MSLDDGSTEERVRATDAAQGLVFREIEVFREGFSQILRFLVVQSLDQRLVEDERLGVVRELRGGPRGDRAAFGSWASGSSSRRADGARRRRWDRPSRDYER
jgi:hypothetical protein